MVVVVEWYQQIKLEKLGSPEEEHILVKTSRMQKKAGTVKFIIIGRKTKITKIDANNYDKIKVH